MNDNAIKNYSIWAHDELLEEAAKQCLYWDIAGQRNPAGSSTLDGRVLTPEEMSQRADLMLQMKELGRDELLEKAAYTWFNRLIAVRFMEVNDRLPGHIRMLSAADNSFKPQVLEEALSLSFDALDKNKILELVQQGDDEALFRHIFLAECDQLADYMPTVFDHVGSSMELLLPDRLLNPGGIVETLVSSIPEADWQEGVEIIGWMYQYYVSERKDEVYAAFKKGKKAEREDIAPATQLFTPNWIVRYLVENSLGRLWVLNHPESSLPERMPFFVPIDKDAEKEFKKIPSPEEISVIDPACGSGHILVYVFDLLSSMYEEAGYSRRDAARLIIERNISGIEIDPRAAALSSFAVTMKACELDPRFLRRGISPHITVLSRIEFSDEEKDLLVHVKENTKLLDTVGHFDECGSLFVPTRQDLEEAARDLASLAEQYEASLFTARLSAKLEKLLDGLRPLVRTYDVVVANPPYMGSKNMNKWLVGWTRKNYPESRRDLCTAFIMRGFTLSDPKGYSAMVTMESWMFLSSYEKMRENILDNHRIATMVYMNHNVMRIAFNTCATIFANHHSKEPGLYTKVEYQDLNADGIPYEFPVRRHAPCSAEGALEALANPACGWFYRKDASQFEDIPGTPIAYWVSNSIYKAFERGTPISEFVELCVGLQTGDNGKFLRLWWEVSSNSTQINCSSATEAEKSGRRWFPFNKGGEFRKWYGNDEYVVNWENDGKNIKSYRGSVIRNPRYYFKPGLSWSNVSSGMIAFRYKPKGFIFDTTGPSCFIHQNMSSLYLHGLCNSSAINEIATVLSPTMHFDVGRVAQYPVFFSDRREDDVSALVRGAIELTKTDWDNFEISWNFKRHPLV